MLHTSSPETDNNLADIVQFNRYLRQSIHDRNPLTISNGKFTLEEMATVSRVLSFYPEIIRTLQSIHSNTTESPEWVRTRIECVMSSKHFVVV